VDAVLRTPRTVLRRFTAADAAALVALDADPVVMRWLTGGRPTPATVVEREVLPRILVGYGRDDGPGRLAAEDPSTGAFLGWFGLRPVEGRGLELGYRLRREVWGRGLATEGARALVRLAFEDLGAERVYAETMTVNAGSRRVLEKAGLRHVRTFDPGYAEVIPGSEHGEVEYALTAEQYRAG
jgi:RimJ/RimL family protein N-acetyltransferase